MGVPCRKKKAPLRREVLVWLRALLRFSRSDSRINDLSLIDEGEDADGGFLRAVGARVGFA